MKYWKEETGDKGLDKHFLCKIVWIFLPIILADVLDEEPFFWVPTLYVLVEK